jgi:hypothetical protein
VLDGGHYRATTSMLGLDSSAQTILAAFFSLKRVLVGDPVGMPRPPRAQVELRVARGAMPIRINAKWDVVADGVQVVVVHLSLLQSLGRSLLPSLGRLLLRSLLLPHRVAAPWDGNKHRGPGISPMLRVALAIQTMTPKRILPNVSNTALVTTQVSLPTFHPKRTMK